MKTPARIREAASADTAQILGLIRELAEYEHLSQDVEATQEAIEAALFGPGPKVFCDIAEEQGTAAGMAIWFYTFSTFRGRCGIWIEDLYVRPDFRGQGLGRALIARAARRCAEENLGRLEWSVLDWNEPSIGFYRKLGARLMSEWTICRMEGEALHAVAGPVRP
ncbi:GNAT family N-acetyltransferase [Methylocapsa palsarum]|uniref:L-amino acid N-acyltransferase YncA n=1 Tax=Methylocapsa palsarum TaxID=1612308 RepID=A0A1I3ZTF7_9HYPH|nr:GNAT family N-acetyltransferase [Methylocapsa palsarum]SFK47180.1 L-amino acid N-acyltransferase YncA [Methylocapsa palsarum]